MPSFDKYTSNAVRFYRLARGQMRALCEEAPDWDGYCQLDQARAIFALIETGSVVSQQAHVTVSHSANARVRSRR